MRRIKLHKPHIHQTAMNRRLIVLRSILAATIVTTSYAHAGGAGPPKPNILLITPMQATDERLAKFPDIADGTRRTYDAMMLAMDKAIGHVRKELADAGLEQNTLVCFISDNGETKGLATVMPAKVKDLQSRWDAWNAANVKPLWGAEPAAPRAGLQRQVMRPRP